MISRIITVEVGVISFSLQVRLITLTNNLHDYSGYCKKPNLINCSLYIEQKEMIVWVGGGLQTKNPLLEGFGYFLEQHINTFCDKVIVFLTIVVSHGRTVHSFITSCTFETGFVPLLPSAEYLFSKINSFSTSCTLRFSASKFQRCCSVTSMDIHTVCDPDLRKNKT